MNAYTLNVLAAYNNRIQGELSRKKRSEKKVFNQIYAALVKSTLKEKLGGRGKDKKAPYSK